MPTSRTLYVRTSSLLPVELSHKETNIIIVGLVPCPCHTAVTFFATVRCVVMILISKEIGPQHWDVSVRASFSFERGFFTSWLLILVRHEQYCTVPCGIYYDPQLPVLYRTGRRQLTYAPPLIWYHDHNSTKYPLFAIQTAHCKRKFRNYMRKRRGKILYTGQY